MKNKQKNKLLLLLIIIFINSYIINAADMTSFNPSDHGTIQTGDQTFRIYYNGFPSKIDMYYVFVQDSGSPCAIPEQNRIIVTNEDCPSGNNQYCDFNINIPTYKENRYIRFWFGFQEYNTYEGSSCITVYVGDSYPSFLRDGESCTFSSQCSGGYCVTSKCSSNDYIVNNGDCDSVNEPCDSQDCITEERCLKDIGDSCSYDEECKGDIYCINKHCRETQINTFGDGYCDDEESCKSSDCDCKNNYECSSFGKCIQIGTEENCAYIGNRCESGYECSNMQCVALCGNNEINYGEDCQNCYEDVSCEDGPSACSSFGKCVDLDSENDCGTIGNKCQVNYQCIDRKCKSKCGDGICDIRENCVQDNCCNGKEVSLSSDKFNCGTCGNSCESLLCRDGECKSNILQLNSPCTEDVQCESNLCYNNLCQSGVSIKLGKKLSSIKVGESVEIDLSVINAIDQDMEVQLIIKGDSGMSVSSSDGAASGSLSQFNSYVNVPSRGQTSIILKIDALESGTKTLIGKVLYTLNGKQREFELEEKIAFSECGDGNCDLSLGEDQENCCTDCGTPELSFFKGYKCDHNKLTSTFFLGNLINIIKSIFRGN